MVFLAGFVSGVFATIMIAAVWATFQLARSLDRAEEEEKGW